MSDVAGTGGDVPQAAITDTRCCTAPEPCGNPDCPNYAGVDAPAAAITASAATASYFAATSQDGFDHQRDAYEQGYENGAAAERELVVRDVQEHFREVVTASAANGKHVVLQRLLEAIRELCVADLMDGAP